MTTTYLNWNTAVTSGDIGSTANWLPSETTIDADDALYLGGTSPTQSIDIFGSVSALDMNIANADVTVTGALTTDMSSPDNWIVIAGQNTATVNVDAAWTAPVSLVVGQDTNGNGILNVNAQGSISAQSVTVGADYSPNASGAVGTMTVQGGGSVTTTNGGGVGVDSSEAGEGATGALTVTGAGSSFDAAGPGSSLSDDYFDVGNNGSGVLNVESGAMFTADNFDVGVGYAQPTVANGSGVVNVLSGATLTTYGPWNEIGNGSNAVGAAIDGATGSVTVSGTDSKWDAVGGAIEIGDSGSKSGSLTISDGANVTAGNEFDVGNQSNSTTNDGSYGALLIESGGTAVTGGYLSGGSYYDTVGAIATGAPTSTATVTDAGSSWKMDANLVVDQSGVVSATSGGEIDAETGLDLNGGTISVDSSSTFEVGSSGGAEAGYLTVDASSNLAGLGTINGSMIDNGAVYATDGGADGGTFIGNGKLIITGSVAGTGQLQIRAQETLNLEGVVASSLNVNFDGWYGTLDIGDPSAFKAPISVFRPGDTIDLTNVTYDAADSSYSYNASDGVLTVTEGANTYNLTVYPSDTPSSSGSLAGELTLKKDASGAGTDIVYTAGSPAPFNLWGTALPNFFSTASGPVNGDDWATSNVTDGGDPIWVETETPATGYVYGEAESYSIVLTSQDWIGTEQPLVPMVTTTLIDPFGSGADNVGNLAGALTFSSNNGTALGGLLYWTASATAGDYDVEFRPLTTTYVTAPSTGPNTTLSGSPVTLETAVSQPLGWNSHSTADGFVFSYTTWASATTENIWFQAFNTSGVATSPLVEVAAGVPQGTAYFIGVNHNGGYDFDYAYINGASTGFYQKTFDTTTGSLGSPFQRNALPTYTNIFHVSSQSLSSGSTLNFIDGIDNGTHVIQVLPGDGSSTATTTFDLTGTTSEGFATTSVTDPNDGQTDYDVLAYTDNNQVHLELLNNYGVQIGSDFVVPGLTSFDRIQTLESGSSNAYRVEIDYTVADPSGGTEVEGLIYDTRPTPKDYTLGGSGNNENTGSPFDDTITWAAGIYTVDGGGGLDTFVATSLSASQVGVAVNAQGNVVVSDGQGDVDTLIGFSTIDLVDATITISGNTLTLTGTNNIAGTISGTGTLAIAGGSDTMSSGANLTISNWTESGATTVVTLAENLSYAGSFTQSAGTLALGANTLTLRGANSIGGTISGTGTLAIAGGADAFNGGASLTASSWTVSGGEVTVAEALTYAGNLTESAGASIAVNSGDTLTLTGTDSLSGMVSGAGKLTIAGGATTLHSGGSLTIADVTISGAATLTAGTASISSALTESGAISIVGAGTLTLTGANSIAGTISGTGTLAIAGGSDTMSSGASLTVSHWTESGATTAVTLAENLSYAGSFTQSAGTLALGANTLTLRGANSIGGTISGTGTLAIAGGADAFNGGASLTASSWTVSGGEVTVAEALTYAGNLTESAGASIVVNSGETLTLTGTDSLSGMVSGAGKLTIAGGATTLHSGGSLTIADVTISGAATLTAGTASISSALTESGAISIAGAGTLTLTGANSIAGTISGTGTLAIAGGSDTMSSGASLTVSHWTESGATTVVTLAENLSYAGSFTQSAGTLALGANTLTLRGANSIAGKISGTGTLVIAGGADAFNGGASLTASSWTVSGGAVTVAEALTYAGNLTESSGSIAVNSGDTLTLTGTDSLSGTISGAGSLAITGGAATLHSGASLTVADFTVSGAATLTAGTASISSNFTDSGAISIVAANTLTLNGTDSLSGTVSGAGELAFAGGDTTLHSGASLTVADVALSSPATLTAATATISSHLTDSGAISILSGKTLTLSGMDTLSGTVSGAGALDLAGATTVSGLTIGGSVVVDNSATARLNSVSMTLGDATATDKAELSNAAAGTFDITGAGGIVSGADEASFIANAGLFEKTGGTGTSTVAPAIVNTGEILAASGTLDFKDAVTGAGSDAISGAATLEFDSSVGSSTSLQTVSFTGSGGTLDLGAPQNFFGALSGFDVGGAGGSNDALMLLGAWNITGFSENAGQTQGTLTLVDGAATASIHFNGSYSSTLFHDNQSGGNSTITYA